MEQEGVIKYHLDFRQSDCKPSQNALTELNRVRAVLMKEGMLGQDPTRYEGYGFGNISYRECRFSSFWISGSQTGHLSSLDATDMACVISCDAQRNYVEAKGHTSPSSESMTHGVLYQLDPRINAVIHVHCPVIWNEVSSLGIKSTSNEIAYGTPEMAKAVVEISKCLLQERGLPLAFAMMGHEDGVVAAGNTLNDCLTLLCALQASVKKDNKEIL